MLKDAAPAYVSGGEIGRRFQVSRAAIWKHMEELRQEGYLIDASSRKGYRLMSSAEKLSAWEISDGLGTSVIGCEIIYLDSVDSTNKYAGRLASEGCRGGTTVIAGMQTQGRGRLGRSWESPADHGIYLSVVLRPALAPFDTPILTLAAAAAIVNAIKKCSGLDAGIKWPNDIITGGKKVCGILLEMNSEADQVNYVVIGIGINFSQKEEDFPAELKSRAISLKSASLQLRENASGTVNLSRFVTEDVYTGFNRLTVIQAVLRELDAVMKLIEGGESAEVLEAWRKHSVTLGRDVAFNIKGAEYTGTAIDITGDGRLLVDCMDGVRRELISGEISIRGIYGYV